MVIMATEHKTYTLGWTSVCNLISEEIKTCSRQVMGWQYHVTQQHMHSTIALLKKGPQGGNYLPLPQGRLLQYKLLTLHNAI